jgi:hypothetical protein
MRIKFKRLLGLNVLAGLTFLIFFVQNKNQDENVTTPEQILRPKPVIRVPVGYIPDSVKIITIANFAIKDQVHEWINDLEKLLYKDLTVFCLDQKLLDYLKSLDYPLNASLVPKEWLSSSQTKALIWYNLLFFNQKFVYSEPSVSWKSQHVLEHMEYQYKNSKAEVIFSLNEAHRQTVRNADFFFATATDFVKELFSNTVKEHRVNATIISDQEALSRVLSKMNVYETRVDNFDFFLYKTGMEHELSDQTSMSPLVINSKQTLSGSKNNTSPLEFK